MLSKIKAYLKFLLQSTNQHGVHSPFVYDLVTRCFYNHKHRDSYDFLKKHVLTAFGINLKKAKLLNRLVSYFNYEKVVVFGDSSASIFAILDQGNSIEKIKSTENTKTIDFIFFNHNLHQKDIIHTFEKAIATLHNDSLVIINNPYTFQETWNSIKKHPSVSVTIDTFDLGFIFFRKEQAKEHFTVRL